MKTIEIKIKSRYFPKLQGILEKMDFLESYQVKSKIEPVTKISEIGLAEEWNSLEDQRWDDIL